jgi:hypothetical protein
MRITSPADDIDIHAPGPYLSIHCGNCRRSSNFENCMRDANGYTLPISQWRCPRCAHQWAIVARPVPTQPGRKYIVVKIIRQGGLVLG